MRRGSDFLPILLACTALTSGLDPTTFRQSYSRASLRYWSVSADARTGREAGYPTSDLGVLSGSLGWRTAMLSDDLDLDAVMVAFLSGGAQGGVTSETMLVAGKRTLVATGLHPAATGHAYLAGTDGFVRAALDFYGQLDSYDERYGSARATDRRIDLELRTAQVGLGYGRMRDAWPLYKAARLARILEQEGALAHRLSDDELRELGGFISRSWKLFYAHERAAKFYYDSLEQLLVRAGAIREPLSAYTLFRLDETPLIGSDERRFGMRGFVAVNAVGSLISESYGLPDTAWTHLDTLFRPSYQAGWEFNGLRGLRWTYGASAAYILPWPRQRDTGLKHGLVLAASAGYDISDRLVARYDLDLQPLYQAPAGAGGDARISLPSAQRATFSYYVSERLAVRLGGSYSTGFELLTDGRHGHTAFTQRWAMALTMTFGRIPEGWGEDYYQ